MTDAAKGLETDASGTPVVCREFSVRLAIDDLALVCDEIGTARDRSFLDGVEHDRVEPSEVSLCHAVRT